MDQTQEVKAQEVVVTFEWRGAPEDLNLQEMLQELRNTGSAHIVNVKVEDA